MLFQAPKVLQGACQRLASPAGGGLGGKKPKGEPAKGAESLRAGRMPPPVRVQAMLGVFLPLTYVVCELASLI